MVWLDLWKQSRAPSAAMETKISKAASEAETAVAHNSMARYQRWRALSGCPRLAGQNESTCLQVDLMRWERSNFGLQPPWTSAFGVVEEFGELFDATATEDVLDAIGDILVFACNLASKLSLDFDTIMTWAEQENSGGGPAVYERIGPITIAGQLGHVILKADQKIRGYEDREVFHRDGAIVIARAVREVFGVATQDGHDAREILHNVAEEVMKRNWAKDKVRGGILVVGNEAMAQRFKRAREEREYMQDVRNRETFRADVETTRWAKLYGCNPSPDNPHVNNLCACEGEPDLVCKRHPEAALRPIDPDDGLNVPAIVGMGTVDARKPYEKPAVISSVQLGEVHTCPTCGGPAGTGLEIYCSVACLQAPELEKLVRSMSNMHLSEGEELDRHGALFDVPRLSETETDVDYRARMLAFVRECRCMVPCTC